MAVLRHALSDALRLGLVHRNACDLVDVPRVRRREIKPLPQNKRRNSSLSTTWTSERNSVRFALATGMRRENCSLYAGSTSTSIMRSSRFEASLQIRQGQWVVAHSQRRRTAGARSHFPAPLSRSFRRHRVLMAEERLRLGPAWEDDELVFPNTAGRMQDPTYIASTNSSRFYESGTALDSLP